MINLRINTIVRLANFTTALAYKHKVKQIRKIRDDFWKWKKIIIGKIVPK